MKALRFVDSLSTLRSAAQEPLLKMSINASLEAEPPKPSPLPSPVSTETALLWAQELEQLPAPKVIRWAFEEFAPELAIVTSFQAEGMVVLDMASREGLPLRILTIDTGRLHEETFLQVDRVRTRYGLEVEIVTPSAPHVQELVRLGGPNLFLDSKENRLRCCHVRKVEPFRRAVSGLQAWLAGIRRDQTGERAAIRKVEIDRGNRPDGSLLKVNPLADWTEDQVWSYIREHGVPYHPLYDRGYRSIGCAPCTRPSRPGEDPRQSRWWWELGHKECGLHLVDASTESQKDVDEPESAEGRS